MATGKTTTLTFRIEPELKEALRTAAQQEHRSIANMVEVTALIPQSSSRQSWAPSSPASFFSAARWVGFP